MSQQTTTEIQKIKTEIKKVRAQINKLKQEGSDTYTIPNEVYRTCREMFKQKLSQIEIFSMLYSLNQMPEWGQSDEGPYWKAPILNSSISLMDIKDILNKEIFTNSQQPFSKKTILFLDKHDNDEIKKYFWNTTFPNIFHGFVSDEMCEKAECYLKEIYNEGKFEYFIQGSISFIFHNYLFQNSFQYNLFHPSNSNNTITDHFIDSLFKLNPHQNNILKMLLTENKEEFSAAIDEIIQELLITRGFDYSQRAYQGEIKKLSKDELLKIQEACEKNEACFCIKLSEVFSEIEETLITQTDMQILKAMYNNNNTSNLTDNITLNDRYSFYIINTTFYCTAGKNKHKEIIPVQKHVEDKIRYDWEDLKRSWEKIGRNPTKILLKENPEKNEDDINTLKKILTGLYELKCTVEWIKEFKDNIYSPILFYPEIKEYYKSLKFCLQGLCNFHVSKLYEQYKQHSFRKTLFNVQFQNFKSCLEYSSHFQPQEQRQQFIEKIKGKDTERDIKRVLNQEDKVQSISELYCKISDELRNGKITRISSILKMSFVLTNTFLDIFSRSFLYTYISKSQLNPLPCDLPPLTITNTLGDDDDEISYIRNIFENSTTILSYIRNIFYVFNENIKDYPNIETNPLNRVLLFESIPIINKMIYNFIGSENNQTPFYLDNIESNYKTLNNYVQYLFDLANEKAMFSINKEIDSKARENNKNNFLRCVQQAYKQLCEYTGEKRKVYVPYFYKLKNEFEEFQQYFIQDNETQTNGDID